jgi:acyl carrier protein
VPANNETEEKVARVFEDVLGIEKVGLQDNYFELGGNSLLALQVVGELQRAFDVQLSPIAIFEYPTVRQLARHLGPAKDTHAGPSLKQITDRRKSLRERGIHSDIAIIGMAGRFPGANTVPEFWQNIVQGVESLTYFTDEELRQAGVDPVTLGNPNYVKARAILEDIDQFDATFFGFSPREAELMDPQHRLLLETAVQTLEASIGSI